MSSSVASTLSFNAKTGALFTSDEIRHLMAVEFERSRRYHYPIVCLMVGIDRLASLETYYGRSAGERIVEQIVDLVQHATRASDFLATRVDDRILAVIPHTTRSAGMALARRILTGVRRLDVRVGPRPLRVTVSIGMSHNQLGTEVCFPTLVRVAEDGLSVADSAGGDRFVETELYQLYERQLEEASPKGSITHQLREADDFEARARSMAEEILSQALARMGQGVATPAPVPQLDEDLLAQRVAEREAELVREAQEHARELEAKEATYRGEIENLQRRVAKLSRSLSETEVELRRVVQLKDSDHGLASIYRGVQGVDLGEDHVEVKQEMMTAIFQANLALRGHSQSA